MSENPELFTLDLAVSMVEDHRDDDQPWVRVDGEAYPVTFTELITAVRAGVESGTIEGEVLMEVTEKNAPVLADGRYLAPGRYLVISDGSEG